MLFKSWRVNLKNRAKVKVIFCYACLKLFIFHEFLSLHWWGTSANDVWPATSYQPKSEECSTTASKNTFPLTSRALRHCPMFLIPARTVNRKWFDVKICKNKKKRVTRKVFFHFSWGISELTCRTATGRVSSLIIHVIWDDMPILPCCCSMLMLLLLSSMCRCSFIYLLNSLGNESKKNKKIFLSQHSWLCSSYWHFQHTLNRFGATWGILFLFLLCAVSFFFSRFFFLWSPRDNRNEGFCLTCK